MLATGSGRGRGRGRGRASGHTREHEDTRARTDSRQPRAGTTSFPIQLLEYFRANVAAATTGPYEFLKYYQNLTRMYVQDGIGGAKGVLVYHAMGLGKTLLAIAIAVDMITTHRVIMMTSRSLRSNMRNSIYKYVRLRRSVDPEWPIGKLDSTALTQWIDSKFTFVSSNAANSLAQLHRAASTDADLDDALAAAHGHDYAALHGRKSLNDVCLIVDEAHNLFRAITNGSQNALGIYQLVVDSPRCRFFPLTGTPIASDPFELVPCFNMLARTPILPEMYADFYALYVDPDRTHMRNRWAFQNRIAGLVSHVTANSTPGKGLGSTIDMRELVHMPEVLPYEVVRVTMTREQYVAYAGAREAESLEGKTRGQHKSERVRIAEFIGMRGDPMNKPRSMAGSTYRVRSRQLSNYCPPSAYRTAPLSEIPYEYMSSPKFDAIRTNIERHRGQVGLVYSQFRGIGGIGAFARYLRGAGWREVTYTHSAHKRGGDDTDADATGYGPYTPDVNELPSAFFLEAPTPASEHGRRISWAPDVIGGLDEFTPDERAALAASGYEWPVDGADDSGDPVDTIAITRDPAATLPAPVDDPKSGAIDDTHEVAGDSDGDAPVDDEDTLVSAIMHDNVDIDSVVADTGTDTIAVDYPDSADVDAVVAAVDTDALVDTPASTDAPVDASVHEEDPLPYPEVPTYCIIAGDVDADTRDEIIRAVTSRRNMYGGVVSLIMITAAGAEGIDLKWVRHIHMMDPFFNIGRQRQVLNRGARNDSHVGMPADAQNVILYLYLALVPVGEPGSPTTDEQLYGDSIVDAVLVDEFTDSLDEVSIECLANAGAHCRVCNPTGQPLYTADYYADALGPDPCEPVAEQRGVRANKITLDGVDYWYVEDASVPVGIRVYTRDAKLSSHVPVRPGTPAFNAVLDVVTG